MTDWLPCPPDPATGIAGAYLAACQTELRALKPGNVHVHAAGHGMTVQQFLTSAEVTAPILAEPGLTVGERIHRAVVATREAVGCNTNLGILLLAAPLAQAALSGGGTLRDRLAAALAGLTVADADRTFRAIALAEPAGLGRVQENDVHGPATVTLLDAMRQAQDRDRIARQYATAYADIFDTAVPRLAALMRQGATCEEAAERLFLELLAQFPDSHIIRKYGVDKAEQTRRHASQLVAMHRTNIPGSLLRMHLAEFDLNLKYNGINPGTTADMVVGSLFSLWLIRLV